MNVEVLGKTRDVLCRFLESQGEDDHLWPTGKPWVGTAKIIAREFAAQLLKLFQAQAAEYARRIPERPEGRVKEADMGDDITTWFEGVIFTDDDVWRKRLSQMVLPYMSKGMETGAMKTAAEYGVGISWDLANPRAQNLILGRAIPFANYVQETTHNAVRESLAKGFEEGESIYQLRERVKDLPEFSEYRSEMVARTEVISACNAGELEAYHEMGAAGKKWIGGRDSRTRDWHREANGQVRYLDEPFNVGGEELQHPGDGSAKNRINCLPGETLVSGVHTERVYRRFYAGEVVTIQTASGNKLTGTPNHPVLTCKGWIAISNLQKGDYVFSDCGVQNFTVGVDPHMDHRPIPIKDMFTSLAKPCHVKRVRSGTMDFHGDGIDSDVDIVTTNRLLMNRGQPTLFKELHKVNLEAAFILKCLLASISSYFELSPATTHASHGIMGSLCKFLAFFGSRVGHAGVHTLRSIAWLDASLDEMPPNNVSRYIVSSGKSKLRRARGIKRRQFVREFMNPRPNSDSSLGESLADDLSGTTIKFSDLANAFSTDIAPDEIINIERHSWSGHVYNLQTTSGVYIADGIVTHNCRCTMAPIFDAERVEKERKPVEAREEPGKVTSFTPKSRSKRANELRETLDDLGINNNLSDIHPDLAKAINDEIISLKTEMPKAFGDKPWLRSIEVKKLQSNVYGEAGFNYINLNSKYYSDPKLFKDSLARDEKTKFHPAGTADSWKYQTFRHEFGHIVRNHLEIGWPSEFQHFNRSHGRLPESLGRYSRTNSREAFAEAFFALKYSKDGTIIETTFMKKLVELLKIVGWNL